MKERKNMDTTKYVDYNKKDFCGRGQSENTILINKVYTECKDKFLLKMYAAAAKFFVTYSVSEAKKIISLAKEDSSCIKKGYFKSNDIFVLALDGVEKNVLVRDLQIAFRFFYEEIMSGRKDAVVDEFYELIFKCSYSQEATKGLPLPNATNGLKFLLDVAFEKDEKNIDKETENPNKTENNSVQDDNHNDLKQAASFVPIMMLDGEIVASYYTFINGEQLSGVTMNNEKYNNATRLEIESSSLDMKFNFRIYLSVVYIAIHYGTDVARETEKTASSMLFAPKKYFAFIDTTKEKIAKLPNKIKKAKNFYEVSKDGADTDSYLQNALYDTLAAMDVQINPRDLFKSEINNILIPLSSMRHLMVEEESVSQEDADAYVEAVAPYVFALYTLAQDYKKAISMLQAEKQVYVGQSQPSDKSIAVSEEINKLKKEIEVKSKELREEKDLSQSRKEKIQKLEERVLLLEGKLKEKDEEKKTLIKRIDELDEETNKMSDLLISSGMQFDEDEIESILSAEYIDDLLENVSEEDTETCIYEAKAYDSKIDYGTLLEEQSKNYRILLAGCSKALIQKMGEKHPNIRCTFGKEVTTMEQTFKGADIIFIHTCSISHKQYFKILSVNKNVYRINKVNNLETIEKEMYEHIAEKFSLREKEVKDSEILC